MDDRITTENLRFDTDIINECIEELRSVDNKTDFLSEIATARFTSCNRVYMDDFDKALNSLYEDVITDKVDLRRLPSLLGKLDRLAKNLYKTQLSIYKIL